MKRIMLISALLFTAATTAFAKNYDTEVVNLPAQVMHYGSLPTAVDQVIPVMPASISGLEGFVLLQFDISESGRVSNIEVVNATDDKMAKFTKAMVRRWAFSNPGEKVSVQQPVVFQADSEFPTLLAIN